MCGFSGARIQMLKACGVNDLTTVNVLEDEEIRQGIKELRQLADDPPALRERRIRRRLGHHDGDVPVGRAAAAAGSLQAKSLGFAIGLSSREFALATRSAVVSRIIDRLGHPRY